jgi:hypothetical protein
MKSACAVAVLVLLCGCSCITVPASDSTNPATTLTVIYDETSSHSVSQFVNTTDHNAPLTVHVPAGRTFQIFYAANDAGGVKTLHMGYSFDAPVVNGIGQHAQVDRVDDDFSSCAATYRAKSVIFPYDPQKVRYDFDAFATDFHSNSSAPPVLTVLQP